MPMLAPAAPQDGQQRPTQSSQSAATDNVSTWGPHDAAAAACKLNPECVADVECAGHAERGHVL